MESDPEGGRRACRTPEPAVRSLDRICHCAERIHLVEELWQVFLQSVAQQGRQEDKVGLPLFAIFTFIVMGR